MTFSLNELDQRLAERAKAPADESYTASLIAKGIEKCAEKLGEEAVEAVIAAVIADKKALTNEAADVLYHLLVVLRAADIPLDDVLAELQSRTAQSGLAEKAARGEKGR